MCCDGLDRINLCPPYSLLHAVLYPITSTTTTITIAQSEKVLEWMSDDERDDEEDGWQQQQQGSGDGREGNAHDGGDSDSQQLPSPEDALALIQKLQDQASNGTLVASR